MPAPIPDPDLIALGIRQPWAELIVRGAKTLEVRSQSTTQRGTIYIYTSKQISDMPAARVAIQTNNIDVEALPKGMVIGTVEITDSVPCNPEDAHAACLPRSLLKGCYAWKLMNPRRFVEPLPVRFLPYGIWFYPFQRRNQRRSR